MKNIITLLICISIYACKNTTKNSFKMERTIPKEEISKQKQYSYYIEMAVYLPFELYINDILIKRGDTGVSSAVELNPWLLQNGTYTIKLKLFPDKGDTILNMAKEQLPYRLNFYSVILNDKKDVLKDNRIAKLPLITLDKDLPYFEQSWEIEIKDLPYKLEGWRNGQDLSKWNKKVLQKKVETYFKKLHTILNNGDADTFNELCSLRDTETNIFTYSYDKANIRERFEKDSRKIREGCRGNMLPIKDYTMKIYGKNHQLVALERNTTTELNGYKYNIKGWSPLIRKNKVSGGGHYSIKLYLPIGSDEFVIIRK